MSKKFWLVLASVAFALPSHMVVGQDKADTKEATAKVQEQDDESISDLIEGVNESFDKLNKRVQSEMKKIQEETKDRSEVNAKMQKLFAGARKEMAGLGGGLLKAIEKNPTADDADKGLTFLMQRRMDPTGRAADLLIEHHSKGDGLMDIALSNATRPGPGSKAILAKIMKSEASDNVKTVASYGDVSSAISSFDGTDEGEAKVEELVKAFIEKAGDIKVGRGSLAAMAESQLFEFMNLRIGKAAPEIAAEDIDGVEFKLSDYRGQVVFLDFWGDW